MTGPTVDGQPVVFRWYACQGDPIAIDDLKAARLTRAGERVTPNPRLIDRIKDPEPPEEDPDEVAL